MFRSSSNNGEVNKKRKQEDYCNGKHGAKCQSLELKIPGIGGTRKNFSSVHPNFKIRPLDLFKENPDCSGQRLMHPSTFR